MIKYGSIGIRILSLFVPELGPIGTAVSIVGETLPIVYKFMVDIYTPNSQDNNTFIKGDNITLLLTLDLEIL